ncbi:sigma-70 family RNA polymerase sigma factor [Paraglaciecola aquimarina]|uniref:Sigma-70 family RNA polymerase sigma factor n=1 Tax=Paraglaciecola algarum TaxID=3050085 RepID=A0ABS9DA02_9ALTE|nr:sigma-70 family RNA polymerase sigma factor [Paraglaciecola sp. G1-23]MCF2949797.1 sigma-70 family RNA polymerase sigma factor [Paraglaciecola sp. G1-23]
MQTNLLSKVTNDKSIPMSDSIDHPQLCQWLKAVAETRDKRAFTHLFAFFAPKIQRISRRKFPNDAQANEVVQETMSNVWRKAHLFDADKGAATTWVYTVMRNVSFDMLRKIKGNKEDNLSDDIWPIAESLQAEDSSFEDHLENKQLLNVIENLPEAQQQVVKGFYLMEMSQEQLATHLNLPLGTIKSRLRLALAKLKVQLGEKHD